MDEVSKRQAEDVSVVEAPVTVVNVDDGDNYDDVFEEEDAFVDDADVVVDEEYFVVGDGRHICLCEGPCPHKL